MKEWIKKFQDDLRVERHLVSFKPNARSVYLWCLLFVGHEGDEEGMLSDTMTGIATYKELRGWMGMESRAFSRAVKELKDRGLISVNAKGHICILHYS